jgi:tRNA pseudouridine38-40 synthase
MSRESKDSRQVELSVAYLGWRYLGWQIQPQGPTVQAALNEVLSRVLGHPVHCQGASRTDSGVHAHDQRVRFCTANPIPLAKLERALNLSLPWDIRVRSACLVTGQEPLRRSASGKHYAYLLLNQPRVGPLLGGLVHHVRRQLFPERLLALFPNLLGKRDFRAFQSSKDQRKSSISILLGLELQCEDSLIALHFLGRNFLHHQVRNLVGSMLLVADGTWQVETFLELMELGERQNMGATAPARGLHLLEVFRPPGQPRIHRGPCTAFLRALAAMQAFYDYHPAEPFAPAEHEESLDEQAAIDPPSVGHLE